MIEGPSHEGSKGMVGSMSLKWVRGISPYVFNDFGKLQIGPDAEPQAFQARAETLVQKIAAGERVELAGQVLDDHAINEAARNLLDPASRAGELLHWQPTISLSEGLKPTIAYFEAELARQALAPRLDVAL